MYLEAQGWECHVLAGGTTGNERKGTIHIYKPTLARKLVALLRQFWQRTAADWLADRSLRQTNLRFWLRHLIYRDVGAEIMRTQEITLISAYNLLTYGPVGGDLARRFHVPLVISIFGEIYKNPSIRNSQRYFVDLLDSADMLLSCSTHCGNSIQSLGSDQRVETIAYGIATNHFTPGFPRSGTTPSVSSAERTILFVGRLDREMGLDSFVTLAGRLLRQDPTLRCEMVGQTGDFAQAALEAGASSDGRMVVVQNVRYEDLPNFYRRADCLVVPTRGTRTCSSLAAMEAMATGVPVIAFDIGGIREIVKHEVTGLLVPPEDIDALHAGVSRVLADAELHQRLSVASLEYAKAHFDESRTNRTIEARFLSLVGAA